MSTYALLCCVYHRQAFFPAFQQHFSAVTASLSCFCTASNATTYSGCLSLLADSLLFFRENARLVVQTLIKRPPAHHSHSAQRFMHFLVLMFFLELPFFVVEAFVMHTLACWYCHCHRCCCCCHYWWQENKRAELSTLPRAFFSSFGTLPVQLLHTRSVLLRLLLFLFFPSSRAFVIKNPSAAFSSAQSRCWISQVYKMKQSKFFHFHN